MALSNQVNEPGLANPAGTIRLAKLEFRTSTWLLGLALLALVLRLVFLLLAGPNAPLTGDELAYQQIAVNLAQGRGFVQNNNPFFPGQTLYAWQAPLYPLSLGLLYRVLGPNPLFGKLFGILISVVTVGLTYDLARRVLRSDRAALLAALFVAVYPGLLTNAHLLLSETLFTALLALAFDLLAAWHARVSISGDRPDRAAMLLLLGAGGVWGLATLTRGVTLYFVIPLALWFLFVLMRRADSLLPLRQAVAATVLFSVAAAVVIAPWTARNYTVWHQFVLLETKGGVNFWLGNSPYTPSDFIRNVWKVGVREPILAALPSDEIGRDRTGYALGLSYVTREPLTFLARLPVKFADFWGFERNLVDAAEATRDNRPGGWSSLSKVAADFLSDLAYVLLVLLAIGGFIYAPDDRWKLLLGGFVLYFIAVHIVVFGDGRFHFPLIPLLALYGAWFALNGPRASTLRGLRPVGALLLVLVFAAVWGHEILAAIRALHA